MRNVLFLSLLLFASSACADPEEARIDAWISGYLEDVRAIIEEIDDDSLGWYECYSASCGDAGNRNYIRDPDLVRRLKDAIYGGLLAASESSVVGLSEENRVSRQIHFRSSERPVLKVVFEKDFVESSFIVGRLNVTYMTSEAGRPDRIMLIGRRQCDESLAESVLEILKAK